MLGRLHVANLSRTADERNLEVLFAPYGTVRSAQVTADPTSSSRNTGTGRVEMSSDDEATAAIAALNGTLYCGRALEVGWAVPTHHAAAADDAGAGGGQGRGAKAVTIETDAEAAARLAAKTETLILQAGGGALKRETRTP